MADVESPDLLCEQAREHLKQGEVDKARDCYERAVALSDRHLGAHEGLAKLCFSAKDYARAAELFKRAYQLDPRRVEPLVNLGAVYNRQGNFAEAVRSLRKALAMDRKCAPAYYNLGIAYKGQNQFSMAVSAYKEAIRFAPEMVDAYYNLGNVLLEMGNAAQAVAKFEQALKIRPDFEKARHGLERAQAACEQAKRAISPFGRLVNENEVRKKQQATQTLRELTPQERYEDRLEVHRIAKEAEQLAGVWMHQIRDELEAAVLNLSRHVTDSEDPRAWVMAVEQFDSAVERYERCFRMLTAKTGELRAHEERIRGAAEQPKSEGARA